MKEVVGGKASHGLSRVCNTATLQLCEMCICPVLILRQMSIIINWIQSSHRNSTVIPYRSESERLQKNQKKTFRPLALF